MSRRRKVELSEKKNTQSVAARRINKPVKVDEAFDVNNQYQLIHQKLHLNVESTNCLGQ